MPPTDESESEFIELIKKRKRMMEVREARVAHENMVKNMEPFEVQSHAQKRVESYPAGDLGLPKPYGAMAPFYPTPVGANMRHYRKPEIREVEH